MGDAMDIDDASLLASGGPASGDASGMHNGMNGSAAGPSVTGRRRNAGMLDVRFLRF